MTTHILSSHDYTPSMLSDLFRSARSVEKIDLMRNAHQKTMDGKIMGTLFLEPSTRTRWSFETAMKKLGGAVISTEAGDKTTSRVKGESLEDTLRTVSQYVDFLVVRCPQHMSEWGEPLLYLTDECTVINAGDGGNEHPTQALTDAFTIHTVFGTLENLKIGVVGDLPNSRTIHSLINLLGGTEKNKFVLHGLDGRILPKGQEPVSSIEYVNKNGLEDALPELDVLYMNRVQAERSAPSPTMRPFVLSTNHLESMKNDSIVLNPGPRREEMPKSLDGDPRIMYFQQAKNGLYVRMALLGHLLN